MSNLRETPIDQTKTAKVINAVRKLFESTHWTKHTYRQTTFKDPVEVDGKALGRNAQFCMIGGIDHVTSVFEGIAHLQIQGVKSPEGVPTQVACAIAQAIVDLYPERVRPYNLMDWNQGRLMAATTIIINFNDDYNTKLADVLKVLDAAVEYNVVYDKVPVPLFK